MDSATCGVWIVELVWAIELEAIQLHEPGKERDEVVELLVGLGMGHRKVGLRRGGKGLGETECCLCWRGERSSNKMSRWRG